MPDEIGVKYNDKGDPVEVQMKPPRGQWMPVSLNRRPWRIDQYWWRGTEGRIARTYYEVDPGNAPVATIYRDDNTGV